jgi:glycosyltransferase involved in cell wall biosynthesis
VLGHLRAIKDPLRAAWAARALPSASRVRVLQLGRGLDARWVERARAEERRNPRYRWLGERSHARALELLARCDAMVLSSLQEGGANAIGEAAALGVPILASRIDGTLGLLGPRHPGYFPVRDTRALRELLLRVERDARFRARLTRASRRAARLFEPAREREAWRQLLAGITCREDVRRGSNAGRSAPGDAALSGAQAAGERSGGSGPAVRARTATRQIAQVRKPAQTSRRSGV